MHSGLAIRALTLALVTLLVPRSAGAGPTYTRLSTPGGPIHVWVPDSLDPDTAGVVVYVHGYFADVDRVWREHRLAEQFAHAGIEAVFIACEAPRSASAPVNWPQLGPLLDVVARKLGRPLPTGGLAAVGHSGAHRTLTSWLDEPRLDTIVLVDALYGDKPQFRDWLLADPSHRLIDAAAQTQVWSEALHATIPGALVFDGFPSSSQPVWLPGARAARVVYVRSQLDHMQLVTSGIALPALLRTLRLPERDSAVSRSGRTATDR